MARVKNPFKPLLSKIPAPLRNKYYLILAVFVFWMIFFDKHSIYTQYRLMETQRKLELDKLIYEGQIKKAKRDRLDLEQNKEKYARERFFMRQTGEDVFVIEEK